MQEVRRKYRMGYKKHRLDHSPKNVSVKGLLLNSSGQTRIVKLTRMMTD